MDRYQVSDRASGPWLEFVTTDRPQVALDTARNKMGWNIIWVAKMRPLRGNDVLPEAAVFWGETMERLSVLFGNNLASQFAESVDQMDIHHRLAETVTRLLEDNHSDVWVPGIKKAYGLDQNVKPGDFDKVSFKDLVKA